MLNITKSIIIVSFILFTLTAGAILAQGDTSADTTATAVNEEITSQDLDVSDPKLLPGNPFYFLKEWGRGVQSWFAFGNLKKADLQQKFASERLIELKKLVEEGKISSDILEKATEKYEKTIDKIKQIADKIKGRAENDSEVNKFLEKFTNQQVLHEKILEKLEGQVPEQVLEKIKKAREQHLERFKEVMTKLQENKDKIAEKIQNALQNGDEINSEILDKIKEKMPEEVQQKIGAIRENIINKMVEKAEQKNERKNCPVLTKPSPDFCQQGKIKVEKDNKGCATEFKCLEITSRKECKTDADCPTLNCIKAPCPQSKCVEEKCEIIKP